MAKVKKKTENRGGKREGAGRKSEALSVRQAKEFERVAKDLAEEFGMTMQEVIGRMVYDKNASMKDVQTAAKLYWDKSVIGVKEGGEADRVTGPAIFLPEKHPRLTVVDIGKSDKPSK